MLDTHRRPGSSSPALPSVPCSACCASKFDFEKCVLNRNKKCASLVGAIGSHDVSRVTARRGALPAVMEIAEFARAVKKGQVRAVDAARDQVDVEGAPFWICQVIEDAFQATAPVVKKGKERRKGEKSFYFRIFKLFILNHFNGGFFFRIF